MTLLFLAGCATGAAVPDVIPMGRGLKLLWEGMAEYVAVTEEGGVLYADGRLVCADGETGAVRWSAEVSPGPGFHAWEDSGTVVVVESPGSIRTFGAGTGEEGAAREMSGTGWRCVPAPGRVYAWSDTRVLALGLPALKILWEWRSGSGSTILNLIADEGHSAVDLSTGETFELEFSGGRALSRHLGRAAGWKGGAFHVLRGDEVWGWHDGRFVESRRLNGYEGGAALLVGETVIHEASLRFHVGGSPGVLLSHEGVCEGAWAIPLRGSFRRSGPMWVEERREGIVVRSAWSGRPLFEVRERLRSWAINGHLLCIVTRDRRLSVYRLT